MGIFDFFKKKPVIPFVSFEIIKKKKGDYEEFYKKLVRSSLIMLIIGKRGSGKTAFGMKLAEVFHHASKRKVYTLGYEEAKLPYWMKKVRAVEDIPNNSLTLLDEGAIFFFSRESMKNPNKALSKLMAIARHKNLTLILITQSSALIDLNVLRLADTLFLKEPSLLQAKFERKAIKDMYEKVADVFKEHDNKKSLVYVWDDDFEGLLKFNLPEFWNEGISTSFKNL
jgi:energy-coupling factor transporter ATP-binding protein EcfA2